MESDRQAGRDVLLSAVSEKEWRKVPSEIIVKLETYIGSKFDELITSKAILETRSYTAASDLQDLQGRHDVLTQEFEQTGSKLNHANNTITELEIQLSNSVTDVGKLQTSCTKLESDFNEMRSQRNTLMSDNEELNRKIVRRNGEIERQKTEMEALSKQFEEAIAAKCEILAQINEVQSMKLSVEYREKHMEQERALMQHQIDALAKDVEKKTEELLHMRRDNSSRCVQLDIKLTERTQELANANESVKQMTEKNNALIQKTEELIEKMAQEKENYVKTLEAAQHEVDAQKKIAELYKKVGEEQTKLSEDLKAALQDLKEKLADALENYGDLETKCKEMELSHEEIVAKKNEYIAMLKKELGTANDLISSRGDNAADDDDSLPKLAPGMSFTEIYSRYVQVNECLSHEKAENKRLQSYFQSIIQEIEEKGPLIAKQRESYEKAMDTVEALNKQLEEINLENQQLRDVTSEFKRSQMAMSRENDRYKKEISDLSRQVCHLLREVEISRTGSTNTSMDHDLSDSTCSADIISKRLVTFSDIQELQTANSRLLTLVRELSSKQEEAEEMDLESIVALKSKLEQMRDEHATLLEEQEKQQSMMRTLTHQRDSYREMYLKSKGMCQLDDEKPEQANKDVSESIIREEKYQEIENNLAKKSKEFTALKEELDTYRFEKAANEKIILEQNEKLRAELQEMMRQNTKMSAKCETNDEMIKVLKSNADVYKQQIERLEDRVRIYSESIVKHETAQQYLKDQVMDAQTKLSKCESQLNNLNKEIMLVRDSEARVKYERDYLLREQQAQSAMLANIELIKATLERNDAESRIRLEDILKDAQRECAALRRRLQEEQDKFRELNEKLKSASEMAIKQMEEEKTIAEGLRSDLSEARNCVATKALQLEELSKKLKNPILDDLEVSVEKRRFRDVEQKLFDSQADVQTLTQRLKISKAAVEQHANTAQAAELQLKDLHDKFSAEKADYEKQISMLQKKSEELQEKNAELQGELSLQSDGQVSVTSNLHSKLSTLEIRNKVVGDELSATKASLEEAREQVRQLQQSVSVAENKYIEEMKMRSEDLQTMRNVKEERTKLADDLSAVKCERDQIKESFDEAQASWVNQEELYKKAKVELDTRNDELNKQNALLLNQLEAFNEQMTLLHSKISEPNRSMGESSFNRSFVEDESKSSEQLVTVIKYLRREKDLAINKCEILEAEHNRILAEQTLLKRQYDDAKSALQKAEQNEEVSIVTAARHAEVLRKVETLNALTDSNRSLRAERDALIAEVDDLKKRTTSLEEQMTPLQEKNAELQKKSEAMQTENITLRSEATKWRQRSNMLLEKSNRTSPEDWKKLQQERETLVKHLAIEKGAVAKLNEEVSGVQAESAKLSNQIKQLTTQLESNLSQTQTLNDELNALRPQVTSLSQELDNARLHIIGLNEDNRKLTESAAGKDVAINEVKNNLSQIRKIAKKYKVQAEEQQKEMDALKTQLESSANAPVSEEKREEIVASSHSQLVERISELEAAHSDRINELTQQVSTSQEESEKSKKELDTLSEKLTSSLEKEERFKVLFKNAKDRIVSLTEQNTELRTQIESRGSDSSASAAGGSGDNGDLQRHMKEKEELVAEAHAERERLMREIETLTQRVNNLQRQLGLQQGSKPSTSSEKEKSTTEPPTANIKPMAGHSTNTQTQSVTIQPWRSAAEPPLASIRPMSQQRTLAVLPTSQSPSTVMVPPQQQVHTTGNSGIEAMSSSPTSSHTDYVPATSSASMLGPRQVAVPPTQSNQDNEDDDSSVQVQQVQQQQVVAMVLPRVEPPSSGTAAQDQGTSSSSSSNTVTTTQAGLKRQRDSASDTGEDSKASQQPKRTRIVQGTSSSGAEGSVSESGLEVEYQVPTSSQRDHEEDAVIVVESDDDGPDEGEGEEYSMPYAEADQDDEGGNEVEVIEDSSEVPNQSERPENDLQADADEDCEAGEEREEEEDEEEEGMQPEASSSGANISTSVAAAVTVPSFARTRVAPLSRSQQGNLVVMQAMGEGGEEEEKAMQPEATSSGTNVSTSVAVTLPSFSRTRVAPLSRSQQASLGLLSTMDESGDDGIVPSTPTLAPSRRCDGFEEAVSSPQVPSGRFTFMESTASSNASNDVLPEQTLEMGHTNEGTGRSVPNTPLQTSPHDSRPNCEEQPHQAEAEMPTVAVSEAEDVVESGESSDCMGPPTVAGAMAEPSVPRSEQAEESQEGEDGVSSEGEKAASTEEGEEEGREAEASPSTNNRSRVQRGVSQIARRSVRGPHVRGFSRSPQPIVWQESPSDAPQRPGPNNFGDGMYRGSRGINMNYSPRNARRSRRPTRNSYGGARF